jgi:hypothetical protein
VSIPNNEYISIMKKVTVLAVATMLSISVKGQTILDGKFLDINNIRAYVNSTGDLFNKPSGFEVPAGSEAVTIHASNIWIGGIDAGAQLHTSAQTYRQTGTDFWPGPLKADGTITSTYSDSMNRVWKIGQCDIDTYSDWVSGGSVGTNPVSAEAMTTIMEWPAFGPDGMPVAPFIDLNSNGMYEPAVGEVPDIKGDQAIFFVYNDAVGAHTESGGLATNLEIQGMLYGFSCVNEALANTVFTYYKVINRGTTTLSDAYITNWTDLAIGNPSDDFIRCDVTRGAYYKYNADNLDETHSFYENYDSIPPAQAVVFLEGPLLDANGIDDAVGGRPFSYNFGDAIIDNERLGLSNFIAYNNDFSVTGNPVGSTQFYNYMKSVWIDGFALMYGGSGHLSSGPITSYQFPGASDPLGYGSGTPQPAWDQNTDGIAPASFRGVGSYGPITLAPGEINELNFAYVYGRASSGDNMSSVNQMLTNIDFIRANFNNNLSCGCDGLSSISEAAADQTSVFPNPFSDQITVNSTSGELLTVRVSDITGRLISTSTLYSGETLSTSSLSPGVYILSITGSKSTANHKVIKR